MAKIGEDRRHCAFYEIIGLARNVIDDMIPKK